MRVGRYFFVTWNSEVGGRVEQAPRCLLISLYPFIIRIWRKNNKVSLLVVRLLLKVHLFDCLIPPCLGVSFCNFGHRVIYQTVFCRKSALIGLQGHPSEWRSCTSRTQYRPLQIFTIVRRKISQVKNIQRFKMTNANWAIPASTMDLIVSFGNCDILSTWRNRIRWILI